MDYILPKFTSLNSFFQSSNVVITQLYDKMVLTYKEILLLYMNPSYIKTTPINDINPEKSDKFLPKLQIYLGIKIMQEMQKSSVFNNKALVDEFYSRVQIFLKIACLQIKKNITLVTL